MFLLKYYDGVNNDTVYIPQMQLSTPKTTHIKNLDSRTYESVSETKNVRRFILFFEFHSIITTEHSPCIFLKTIVEFLLKKVEFSDLYQFGKILKIVKR